MGPLKKFHLRANYDEKISNIMRIYRHHGIMYFDIHYFCYGFFDLIH